MLMSSYSVDLEVGMTALNVTGEQVLLSRITKRGRPPSLTPGPTPEATIIDTHRPVSVSMPY